MVSGTDASHNVQGNGLTPPWTTDSPLWQDIDQRLDANDLRVIKIIDKASITIIDGRFH